MNQREDIQCIGEIEILIENKNGEKEFRHVKNTVLLKGREALASSLANDIGSNYPFFINRMLFGQGGTTEGSPRYVIASQTDLFSRIPELNKPVSAVVDNNFPYQVIFTSVLTYDDAAAETINEVALQMNNEDLYSMSTFGDIHKTSAMQITWSWRISFL